MATKTVRVRVHPSARQQWLEFLDGLPGRADDKKILVQTYFAEWIGRILPRLRADRTM